MPKFIELNNQQLRLYLFINKKEDQGIFSIPITYHLQKIDSNILQRTLQILVDQHPVLMSKIVQLSGQIKLEVIDDLKVELETINLSRTEAINYLNKDAKADFNLKQGPLFRFKLIFIENNKCLFYSNIHHLIWDGRSGVIFFKQLEKIYAQLLKNEQHEGGNKELSESSLELYKNYQEAQVSYISSPKFTAELQNLKSLFPKDLIPLQLSTDFPRPKLFSHDSDMINFEISSEKMQIYSQFCRDNNITLYNYFYFAFSLILSRMTNQKEFNIGTPTIGRNNRDELKALGFYANTAVIPFKLQEELTVKQHILDTSDTIKKCLSFKKVPFSELLNSFNKEEDSSRLPMYQSFLMYQDFSGSQFTFLDQEYTRDHMDTNMTHSEIDLWLTKYTNKILGGFHYATKLLKKESVDIIQDEFLFVLDQIHMNQDKRIDELEKVSPQGLDRSLKCFSTFDKNEYVSFLHDFNNSKNLFPDKIAVISQGKNLTYKDLDQQANQLGHYLLSIGIKSGDLVAISLPRSCELMVALLGVLKIDCGYLPIDAKFPEDRVAYMLTHSKVKHMLTNKQLSHNFKSTVNITIEDFYKNKNNFDANQEHIFKHLPLQTAYIIYTSGSTGMPKGVELSLSNMTNFLKSMRSLPGMSSDDTLCAVTTLSFDISVLELYLPLICGGTLVIATEEEAKDTQKLQILMHENNVSIMQATPITWRLLFKSGWNGNKKLKVLCGGEKMPEDLAPMLINNCGEIWNMYGPTETTVWSTCKKLNLTDPLITIGKQIDNTSIYILDTDKKPLPIGAIGDLYIGGDGLANGYYHAPELTDERFLPDSVRGEGRMYITGDIGRLTADGEIICLGRSDNQVKVRGHRIELGEVQIQLSKFEDIRESVVIIREDNPGDVRIVAYLILKENKILDKEQLDKFLLNQLPPYMIPEHFITMESFTLTPNGKIDQKKLPSPFEERQKINRSLSPPQSQTEIRLAKIWQKEIGIPQVYLEDDFFDIGGNSLVAASVFHGISVEFKQNIDLALLFRVKNLKELATKVDETIKNGGTPYKFSNLIKLQDRDEDNNDSKKYFFFHALGGNTLNYRVFLKHLTGHDVYGLQATGVDGKNIGFISVDDMAENYVNDIIKECPTGPYNLVGGSLGGLLAYVCAKKLKELGKEVETIAMFDTSIPLPKKSKVDAESRKEVKKTLREKLFKSFRFRTLMLINRIFNAFNTVTPHSIRYTLIEQLNLQALRKHKPLNYQGDIFLIRIPIQKKGLYSHRGLGWENYLDGNIEVDYVDVSHNHFIEDEKVIASFGEWVNRKK